MDSDTDCKIPLLEDIETAVPTSTVPDDRYPVKPTRKNKGNCSRRRCIKKILKKVVQVMFVMFLVFATIATFAGIRAYKWMAVEVQHWTVTEPNSLPTVDVSEAEVELFKMRAKLFWDTIQAGKIPKDFIASATNLNGLAASSDVLRGNAFAEMKTNEFKISVSLPADDLPGGKGRFLVGTETITWDPETSMLRLKMEPMDDTKETFYDLQFSLTKQTDGKTLNLQVVSGEAFGWTVPQDFIDEHNNLLEDLYDCDCHDKDCKRTREFLEGLEISVEDDQVVFHPHAADQHRALRETGNLKSHNGSHWKAHLVRRLLA
jgi:hypothetical protein